MKFFIIFLITFISFSLYAQDSINLNKYIQDDAGLLSYSFEKRMGRYLKKFYQATEVKLHIIFIQSLANKDVQSFNADILTRYGQDRKVILFTLSLSDRLFNVARSENLVNLIPTTRIDSIVETLLPYIKAKRFEHSVTTFSDMAIFSIDSNYKLSPPPVSEKQFVDNRGLLFFLVLFIIVIMLGRKVFSSTILFSSFKQSKKRKIISGSW